MAICEYSIGVGALPGAPDRTQTIGERQAPTCHKRISARPRIEYVSGARILKADKGGKGVQVGGGIRGEIKGFSVAARRRLLYTVGAIKTNEVLPLFFTLTYPERFPEPLEFKGDLRSLWMRMTRAFPNMGAIWKQEPQRRGAPHCHGLAWGVDIGDLYEWMPRAWHEIAGHDDHKHYQWHMGQLGNEHCVQEVRSWRGVWAYAAKYLGKTFEVAGWGDKWTGRFWGVINRNNIPFGEVKELEMPLQEVVQVMRYQRRFSGIRRSGKSLTIFCDADQWVNRLSGEH